MLARYLTLTASDRSIAPLEPIYKIWSVLSLIWPSKRPTLQLHTQTLKTYKSFVIKSLSTSSHRHSTVCSTATVAARPWTSSPSGSARTWCPRWSPPRERRRAAKHRRRRTPSRRRSKRLTWPPTASSSRSIRCVYVTVTPTRTHVIGSFVCSPGLRTFTRWTRQKASFLLLLTYTARRVPSVL